MILDDVFGNVVNGQVAASLVSPPLIIGKEFPLGCRAPDPPVEFKESFEIAKYGMIHTEFVRSLIERWTHRRRYRP
jgi:hypothetical protein